jgi:phosphohistidine phosphatase
MKLYFLRHAHADWPEWSGSDDKRPLTKKGRKQARRAAKFLRKSCDQPVQILSSPLPRASQTAAIVADRLCLELKEEPALAKGFGVRALRTLIARTKGEDLIIVGHEPNFSAVIRQLTGGRVKLAKAGVARVDLPNPNGDGTLVWLISPKRA